MRKRKPTIIFRSRAFDRVFVQLLISCFILFPFKAYPQAAKLVAQKDFPSLVLLLIEDARGQPFSLGSGFFVQQGIIATNMHVISGASQGWAKLIGQSNRHEILGVVAARAHQRQLLITSEAGMATSLEAIRLDFYDFVDETKTSLEQVREHVVAAIYTLDPDASTQQVFRAAEFGINEQERRLREEGMDRFIESARVAADQHQRAVGAASAQPQQPQGDPQGAV